MKLTSGAITAGIVATLVVGIAVGPIVHPAVAAPAAPSMAHVPLSACSGSDDTKNAYCIFRALTHADVLWQFAGNNSSHARPIWQHWQDKCAVGLGECTDARKALLKSNPKLLLPADLLAVDRPVQQPMQTAPQRNDPASNSHSQKSSNELASVLFNPQLAHEIERLDGHLAPVQASHVCDLRCELKAVNQQSLQGYQRQIDSRHLLENSVAVKLIWEVVLAKDDPEDPDHMYPAYIYEPTIETGTKLLPPVFWPSTYPIIGDDKALCPQNLPFPGTPAANQGIPVNCFYHYTVNTHDDAILSQLGQNGLETITGNVPPSCHAYVILVGEHIMVFNHQHKLWQWMTFYWTMETNGQTSWKNPWQHYQMETTSNPAEGQPLSRPEIANPYLEGNVDSMKTNCVSCHSLATYRSGPSKRGDAINIIDGPNGMPGDRDFPNYPQSELQATGIGYFDDSIRTHFLWSLANYRFPAQPPLAATPHTRRSHVR